MPQAAIAPTAINYQPWLAAAGVSAGLPRSIDRSRFGEAKGELRLVGRGTAVGGSPSPTIWASHDVRTDFATEPVGISPPA